LRFPDNQDVWLKDLASYINLKVDKVVDSDPIFKDKQKGMGIGIMLENFLELV
jgi:hypothetical protein